MNAEAEAGAVWTVYERLVARFPQIGAEIVDAIVRQEHAKLTGPVRDLVPVLVEQSARFRITQLLEYDDELPTAG